jgi:hypothetical protein
MNTTTKRSRAKAVQPVNGNGQPAPTNIEVNVDAITWEDLRILMSYEGRDKSEPVTGAMVLELHGLFERIVVGGAKAVPFMRTMEVLSALGDAMKALGNPKV